MKPNHLRGLPENVPQEAKEILAKLLDGVLDVLGDDVIGVYTRGSLALGDFMASLVPARFAARSDPVQALRAE